MALAQLGRHAEAEEALGQADLVFRTRWAENPQDAGAWNGSGSVEALRGHYEQALTYIDKALEIDPDYEEAKQDRQRVLGRLK
jgi:tetratricopeptide (TPR) repeat protein